MTNREKTEGYFKLNPKSYVYCEMDGNFSYKCRRSSDGDWYERKHFDGELIFQYNNIKSVFMYIGFMNIIVK